MVFSDESFLPQIVGLFYATFDPKLGPTVLHQVPENLISSSSSSDETHSRSQSYSRSRSTSASRRTSSRSRIASPPPRSRSRHAARTPSTSRSVSPGSSSSFGPTLLEFAPISEYIIPKKDLHGKLVTFLTSGDTDGEGDEYRVMGFPSVLTGGEGGRRYQRNEYMWNLCFVFHASSSLEAFEPVVRKCGRILRSAELDSAYLSAPSPDHLPLPAVLEQLFEDLNSYSETSINLDGFNSLELKLFPFFPNPPECEDWHVPVALADLNELKDDNWDITAARVSVHIDGVNHVERIAQLADADGALTRETLRHMLYYQVIMMIDIFQYSNMYTLKPSITRLAADETIINECGPYVTRPHYPRLSWPRLLRLYSKLLPGTTVHDWIEANGILALGIDPRRFVSFGIIKGFLRRVHRWPICLEQTSPSMTDGPAESRRKVEFDKSTRVESSMTLSTRAGTNMTDSQLTRSGPGDSTFTLRSQGSNLSIGLGISPTQTPSTNRSPRRVSNHPRNSLPRSLTSIADAMRKNPSGLSGIAQSTQGTQGTQGTIGTHGTLATYRSSAGAGASALKLRQQNGAEARWEELRRLCDGSHHSDELQVRFGLGWRELEKLLGPDEAGMVSGKGKKGVVIVYR